MFYTHISDQYSPFHTKVINVGVRDSTHVLDGLLYHESALRVAEHYTDTAGFTDHVFALMPCSDSDSRRGYATWATPGSTSPKATTTPRSRR